ncbi:MAG: DUF4258 domain-containing protein [Chloroflexi bacterium]|nr:DUF4258 domain-containing protein [Chloroflexota bacterium]
MINELRLKFSNGSFEFSKHAVDQTILRGISVQEIRELIHDGEVIEDYPDDKYGPSCLIFGVTKNKRPLHIQCSYPSRPMIKIITVYEPNSEKWIDFKIRR